MEQPKDSPKPKSPEKKAAPQGNNFLWYMLGLGVLMLLLVTMWSNQDQITIKWSELEDLVEAANPDRPKDTWGIDAKVWKAASPATYVSRDVPPMLLLYADGDDEWRRNQQHEFVTVLGAAGQRQAEVRMIKGRTHNTVWSEMTKDEETSRAILQFVTRYTAGTR